MFKRFLIRTTPQKLLAYFAEHPGQQIHERELVRKTGLAAGAVNKALNELFKADILGRDTRGKTYIYALKRDTADMRLFKVLLMLWRLEPLIDAIRDTSRLVILYGSTSRGSHDERSDVDLLIVASSRRNISAMVRKFQKRLLKDDIRLQPVIKTTLEWAKIERDDPIYFQEVLSGLTLWERPHDDY